MSGERFVPNQSDNVPPGVQLVVPGETAIQSARGGRIVRMPEGLSSSPARLLESETPAPGKRESPPTILVQLQNFERPEANPPPDAAEADIERRTANVTARYRSGEPIGQIVVRIGDNIRILQSERPSDDALQSEPADPRQAISGPADSELHEITDGKQSKEGQLVSSVSRPTPPFGEAQQEGQAVEGDSQYIKDLRTRFGIGDEPDTEVGQANVRQAWDGAQDPADRVAIIEAWTGRSTNNPDDQEIGRLFSPAVMGLVLTGGEDSYDALAEQIRAFQQKNAAAREQESPGVEAEIVEEKAPEPRRTRPTFPTVADGVEVDEEQVQQEIKDHFHGWGRLRIRRRPDKDVTREDTEGLGMSLPDILELFPGDVLIEVRANPHDPEDIAAVAATADRLATALGNRTRQGDKEDGARSGALMGVAKDAVGKGAWDVDVFFATQDGKGTRALGQKVLEKITEGGLPYDITMDTNLYPSQDQAELRAAAERELVRRRVTRGITVENVHELFGVSTAELAGRIFIASPTREFGDVKLRTISDWDTHVPMVDGVSVGRVMNRFDDPVGNLVVEKSTFKRHHLISSLTGSGKTVLSLILLAGSMVANDTGGLYIDPSGVKEGSRTNSQLFSQLLQDFGYMGPVHEVVVGDKSRIPFGMNFLDPDGANVLFYYNRLIANMANAINMLATSSGVTDGSQAQVIQRFLNDALRGRPSRGFDGALRRAGIDPVTGEIIVPGSGAQFPTTDGLPEIAGEAVKILDYHGENADLKEYMVEVLDMICYGAARGFWTAPQIETGKLFDSATTLLIDEVDPMSTALIMATAHGRIERHAKRNSDKRMTLATDEFNRMISEGSPLMAVYDDLNRLMRKFEVFLITCLQNPEFMSSVQRGNSAGGVWAGQLTEQASIDAISTALNLTPEQATQLTDGELFPIAHFAAKLQGTDRAVRLRVHDVSYLKEEYDPHVVDATKLARIGPHEVLLTEIEINRLERILDHEDSGRELTRLMYLGAGWMSMFGMAKQPGIRKKSEYANILQLMGDGEGSLTQQQQAKLLRINAERFTAQNTEYLKELGRKGITIQEFTEHIIEVTKNALSNAMSGEIPLDHTLDATFSPQGLTLGARALLTYHITSLSQVAEERENHRLTLEYRQKGVITSDQIAKMDGEEANKWRLDYQKSLGPYPNQDEVTALIAFAVERENQRLTEEGLRQGKLKPGEKATMTNDSRQQWLQRKGLLPNPDMLLGANGGAPVPGNTVMEQHRSVGSVKIAESLFKNNPYDKGTFLDRIAGMTLAEAIEEDKTDNWMLLVDFALQTLDMGTQANELFHSEIAQHVHQEIIRHAKNKPVQIFPQAAGESVAPQPVISDAGKAAADGRVEAAQPDNGTQATTLVDIFSGVDMLNLMGTLKGLQDGKPTEEDVQIGLSALNESEALFAQLGIPSDLQIPDELRDKFAQTHDGDERFNLATNALSEYLAGDNANDYRQRGLGLFVNMQALYAMIMRIKEEGKPKALKNKPKFVRSMGEIEAYLSKTAGALESWAAGQNLKEIENVFRNEGPAILLHYELAVSEDSGVDLTAAEKAKRRAEATAAMVIDLRKFANRPAVVRDRRRKVTEPHEDGQDNTN